MPQSSWQSVTAPGRVLQSSWQSVAKLLAECYGLLTTVTTLFVMLYLMATPRSHQKQFHIILILGKNAPRLPLRGVLYINLSLSPLPKDLVFHPLSHLCTELVNRLREESPPSQCRESEETGIIPVADDAPSDELQDLPLGDHSVLQVHPAILPLHRTVQV